MLQADASYGRENGRRRCFGCLGMKYITERQKRDAGRSRAKWSVGGQPSAREGESKVGCGSEKLA